MHSDDIHDEHAADAHALHRLQIGVMSLEVILALLQNQ